MSGEVKPTATNVFGMEEEAEPEILFDKVCCHCIRREIDLT